MQKRCPWCGKIVKVRGVNALKDNYHKMTPSSFIYSKCKFCNNFFGQNYKSFKLNFLLLAVLMSILLPSYMNPYCVITIILGFIFILYIRNTPLVKMNENEEFIREQKKLYKAQIIESTSQLKKGYIYFLTENFDDNCVNSDISPIRVEKVKKKDGYLFFSFLYELEKNNDIELGNLFTVFDGNKEVAKLVCITND